MCMVDSCDGFVVVLNERHRKARKEHKCVECHRVISGGETYLATRVVYEGDFSAYKVCAHCEVVQLWLGKECGGFVHNTLVEDIRDHARESAYGFGVMRLAVGIFNKWQRKDGRLFPVPRMPMTSFDKVRIQEKQHEQ